MEKIEISILTSLSENPRLRYVIDFLEDHPLCFNYRWTINNPSAEITINYNAPSNQMGNYHIACYNAFFNFSKKDFSPSEFTDFPLSPELIIPVLSSMEVKNDSQSEYLEFDLFETIFFYISRFEEVFASESKLNQAGWLIEDLHLSVMKGVHDRPIVDLLINEALSRITKSKTKFKSTYSLTHDIDVIYRFKPWHKFVKSIFATIYYGRGWKQLKNSIILYFKMLQGKAKDPYDTFDFLIKEGNTFQEKIIFLMSGGNTKYDNKYSIKEKRIDSILEMAIENGYTIGIHPSYDTHSNFGMFQEEKEILENRVNSKIVNSRQHWLRWSWNQTPYIIDKNEITYDSSLGYNQRLGFRCGTGFPYRLYDFTNEKAFTFLEQPFAIMESAAIHESSKKGKDITILIQEFLEQNKNGTHVMLNFHNSNFDMSTEVGPKLTAFYKNDLIRIIEK